MEPIAKDMRIAVNKFIKEQQAMKEPGALFGLAQFTHTTEFKREGILLADAKELTEEEYVVNGGTAYYDALGTVVEKLGGRKHVVLCIITDGDDRDSDKFSKAQVARMLRKQKEENGWVLVWVCESLESSQVAAELGAEAEDNIRLDSSAFSSTGSGCMSSSVSRHRAIMSSASSSSSSST